MMEVLVFSKRIIQMAQDKRTSSKEATIPQSCHSLPERLSQDSTPPLSLTALQALMWDKVGIIRSGETLEEAAEILAYWEGLSPLPADRSSYELNNMVLTARLIVEAALLREESRGAHFRTDFPQPSPDWLRHIIFRK
jgi:L-aspartate oxidase